ncbi:MAG: NAD(P)-dependent oxidoreductase [Chloroflexi bacterium]|nr:NAD(P)-dependent oxidoreductase [Chloroflexota bacterium]
MRVLVTGGTGRVGVETVRQLTAASHSVLVIGRSPGHVIEGADYQVCDTTDYPALLEATCGCEGIIHLAAIPHPGGGPGHEIFRINCAGTYNVYEAAAACGIRRVVTASSINAFGYNYGIYPFPIAYLPIDEAHPTHTTDPYSFSKQVTEAIADYYWRREGISGVSLRLPAVIDQQTGSAAWRYGVRQETLAVLELLRKDPPAGAKRMNEIVRYVTDVRAQRGHERRRLAGSGIPREYLSMIGWTNFWTGLDTRDTAQALIKGLFASYEGSHALFVNDSRNIVGAPSAELARAFFPEAHTFKEPLEGDTALVSIARARELIGFEPEYHLADTPPEAA